MDDKTDSQPLPPAAEADPHPPAGKGLKKPRPAHVLEQPPGEVGGTAGPEPTRYGDWSHKGIASDF